MAWTELIWFRRVADSCERSNELQSFLKFGVFLDQLRKYQLLKDSAPCTQVIRWPTRTGLPGRMFITPLQARRNYFISGTRGHIDIWAFYYHVQQIHCIENGTIFSLICHSPACVLSFKEMRCLYSTAIHSCTYDTSCQCAWSLNVRQQASAIREQTVCPQT